MEEPKPPVTGTYKFSQCYRKLSGLGHGIFDILEPVVFGPVYEKFYEAIGLVNSGGAISIDGGPVKLETVLNELLHDEAERKRRGEAAVQFVQDNAGASKKIMQFIQEKRLLTS